MVHSNKVLTVSYGTFSCTLEGFEDSFDTMKAIAEYFRDLAADDRYFGAEPPQPDTEMLARIAEREIARQVEARREGSGFVLRAAQAAPAALTGAAAAEAAEETTGAEAPPAPAEPAPEQPQTIEEPAAAEAEIAEPSAEAQAVVEPEAAETEIAEPEIEIAEDAQAETAADEETVAAFMAQAAETAPEEEPELDESEPELADFEAEPIAPAPQPEVEPAGDSIAAKLQRIRAVVSRNEQAAQEADYVEDQHSEDAFAAAPTQDRDEDATEAQAEAETEAGVDATEARRSARLRRRQARAQRAIEAEKAAEEEAAHQVQTARESEAEPDEDEVLFADLEASETEAEAEPDEDIGNILAEDADTAEDRGARAEARRARVVMVKRDELEEDAEDALSTRPVVPSVELPPSTLPPEDEAELMRELAEVEAELRGDSAEAATEIAATPAPDEEPAPRAQAPATDGNADLSRLMAAADERLGAPEAATAREAYSHLRAAVAATQAERSAGGTVSATPDADAYRADLARVVQPHRPDIGGGRRARRAAAAQEQKRPAPLKLVAEQRVDDVAQTAAKTGPVRPRRVAAVTEEPEQPQDGEGFAAFAQEMGAHELPELLEAAAAYMQFVEGRDQFTRPQLIHKAREAAEDEFSREDGLRSFGMLLREGKIVKQDSGRFVASGEIGFQPASRAAG